MCIRGFYFFIHGVREKCSYGQKVVKHNDNHFFSFLACIVMIANIFAFRKDAFAIIQCKILISSLLGRIQCMINLHGFHFWNSKLWPLADAFVWHSKIFSFDIISMGLSNATSLQTILIICDFYSHRRRVNKSFKLLYRSSHSIEYIAAYSNFSKVHS